jgi:hypothetical protein
MDRSICRRSFKSLMIGLFLVLVSACKSVDQPTPTLTAIPLHQTPVATQPTITAPSIEPTAISTEIVETQQTAEPTPANCERGFVAYTMTGRAENNTLSESGVYLACADGSFIQRIMAFEIEDRFTVLSPDSLKASADGESLLLSANDHSAGIWRAIQIQLGDYQTKELLTQGYLRQARLSQDGRFIEFITSGSEPSSDSIALYDLQTHVVSPIFSTPPYYAIAGFNWSADKSRLIVEMGGPFGQNEKMEILLLDMSCVEAQCQIIDQTTLSNWYSNLSFTDEGLFAGNYGHQPVFYVLDVTGNEQHQIDLTAVTPDMVMAEQPSLSPDEEYIVFRGQLNSDRYPGIYVFDLANSSLISLTSNVRDVLYDNPVWIP